MEIRQVGEFRDGDDYVRLVNFRIGSGPWGRFLPTLDNDKQLPPKIDPSWKPLTEVYHQITLAELRRIDGDSAAQRTFIRRHLTPKDGVAGIPVLRLLLLESEAITASDVEYLTHLLPPPNVSIATTPLVYRYRMSQPARPDTPPRSVTGKPVDMSVFLPFAKAFVSGCASAGTRRFGVTVPFNTSHRDVTELLGAYKNVDAPIAVIDANGNTTQPMAAQLRALVGPGGAAGYTLREKNRDDWALYAFDSKPYRGRGEYVAALSLLQMDGPITGFGKRHTLHIRMPSVPRKPPSPGRVMVPRELAYAQVGVPGATAGITKWWARRAAADRSEEAEALRHRGEFEREAMVGSARKFHEWASDGVLSKRLSDKRWIQRDLTVARRANRSTSRG